MPKQVNMQQLDDYYTFRWQEREALQNTSVSKQRRLDLIHMTFQQQVFDNREHLKVIDYGCGSGWLLPTLEFYNFKEVHAYDVTPQALNVVKQRYPQVRVWTGDGQLPSGLPSAYFDVVLCIEVLEHIPFLNQKIFFEDLRRISNTDALVVLTTPNGRWQNRALPEELRQPVEDWVSYKELETLALQSGFQVIRLGTRGIYRFSFADRILLNYRLKWIFTKFNLWHHYESFLEGLGRGITLYAILRAR